jgi:HPt (histidine-containing phosphotransfer) domain-containing protein
MTAHAMKGEREKSLEAGMNDHITKPIDPLLLYASICKYTGRTPIKQELNSKAETANKSEQKISITGLNTEAGLYRSGNSEKVYHKLLRSFSQKYNSLGSQIGVILDEDNTAELAALMHAFAGVAGNMGAEQLYERSVLLSQQLKNAATENKPLSSLPVTNDINNIIEDTNRLILAIEKTLPASVGTPDEKTKTNQSEEEVRDKITKLSALISENNPEELLGNIIQRACIDIPGRLIIPSFSVGRTQAMLYTLNRLYTNRGFTPIKVFTDSPLGKASTRIYEKNVRLMRFFTIFHCLINIASN